MAKRPAVRPGAAESDEPSRLLVHRARHLGQRRVELAPEALHGSDGSDSNERGNQAVLDSGGTFDVLQHVAKLDHVFSPIGVVQEARQRQS